VEPSDMKESVRLAGLLLFLMSLTLLGWWWIKADTVQQSQDRSLAALWDVALFSAFALHHSVLARPFAKRRVERLVPVDLLRSSYVWVASLLLTAMCVSWQPVGGSVYRITGAAAVALGALQVLGVIVGLLAIRRIDIRDLAGLAPPAQPTGLHCGGAYRLVRHPLYLGWVLVVWGTPHMTGDRLLFAVLSTAYLVAAMPFEEAGLAAQFGERYLEYRQTVRWRLIPYIH
jgi:protein-S-isoprenylcysteine O-methyltransferase Ste14